MTTETGAQLRDRCDQLSADLAQALEEIQRLKASNAQAVYSRVLANDDQQRTCIHQAIVVQIQPGNGQQRMPANRQDLSFHGESQRIGKGTPCSRFIA